VGSERGEIVGSEGRSETVGGDTGPGSHILIESEEGFRAEGEIEGGIQDLL